MKTGKFPVFSEKGKNRDSYETGLTRKYMVNRFRSFSRKTTLDLKNGFIKAVRESYSETNTFKRVREDNTYNFSFTLNLKKKFPADF